MILSCKKFYFSKMYSIDQRRETIEIEQEMIDSQVNRNWGNRTRATRLHMIKSNSPRKSNINSIRKCMRSVSPNKKHMINTQVFLFFY